MRDLKQMSNDTIYNKIWDKTSLNTYYRRTEVCIYYSVIINNYGYSKFVLERAKPIFHNALLEFIVPLCKCISFFLSSLISLLVFFFVKSLKRV